jgi:8-oxo-dGTP pyrophosphatase MutT (NUDIX family)
VTEAGGLRATAARRLLATWRAPDADQAQMRDHFLDFLDVHGAAALDRDQRIGHLTASTVVLDAARSRVLLTLHPLIGQWVQLGGHIEPGEATLGQAAEREAFEESGIAGLALDPVPLGLDLHPVTCRDSRGERSPSTHLDVTFLAVAPAGAQHVRSEESIDLAWFPVEALPPGADDVTHRLVAAALRRA